MPSFPPPSWITALPMYSVSSLPSAALVMGIEKEQLPQWTQFYCDSRMMGRKEGSQNVLSQEGLPNLGKPPYPSGKTLKMSFEANATVLVS